MAEKIGEIDIDTLKAQYSIEMANRKIERMQNVVTGADRRMRTWEKTWSAISRVAGAFGIALGAQQLVSYIVSLKDLGREIEANRAKFSSGTQAARDFSDATGGMTDQQIAELDAAGRAYDNFFTRLKVGSAQWMLSLRDMQTAEGSWLSKVADIFAKDPSKDGSKPPAKPQKQVSQQLLEDEEALAELRKTATSDINSQRNLLTAALAIDQKRLAHLIEMGGATREQEMALKQSIGDKKRQIADEDFARKQEEKAAETMTQLLSQQLTGQQSAAKFSEIRLKYERQIEEAIRSQNTKLATQLQAQRDLEEREAARASHKMTPRERLEERKNQRRIERENRQTKAAEDEFQQRWDKGIRPNTKGSEFEKWAKRQGLLGANVKPPDAANAGPTAAQWNQAFGDLASIAAWGAANNQPAKV